MIAQLDERIKDLDKQFDAGKIGQATLRYRLRWAHADYAHLEKLAKRYGFVVFDK